jgi:serine/threonine protein kinase
MVIKYSAGGNLREYLKNNKELSFKDKLGRLVNIVQGLKDIHAKELVHRDFHSGNVLNSNKHSFITDLGLCKPADKTNDGNIYGVLPYVAPEVLRSKQYTLASDIYSFGIVAYEMLTGLPPYPNIPHDVHLSFKICKGLRPNLNDLKIPQLLKDLIEKC